MTECKFECLRGRATTQGIADDPSAWTNEDFPFAALRNLTIQGVPVLASRISCVGKQGWELHFKYEDGLALWDALYAQGVTPVGVETYANGRRMEKSLRLQNADLLTEYNLFECDLARPKVKTADFHGKAAHLEFRARVLRSLLPVGRRLWAWPTTSFTPIPGSFLVGISPRAPGSLRVGQDFDWILRTNCGINIKLQTSQARRGRDLK